MASIHALSAALGAPDGLGAAAASVPVPSRSAASTLDFAAAPRTAFGDAVVLSLRQAGIDTTASAAASGNALALALFVEALLGALHQQLQLEPRDTLQALILPVAAAVGSPALGTLQQRFDALLGGGGGAQQLGGFLHTMAAQVGGAAPAAGMAFSAHA